MICDEYPAGKFAAICAVGRMQETARRKVFQGPTFCIRHVGTSVLGGGRKKMSALFAEVMTVVPYRSLPRVFSRMPTAVVPEFADCLSIHTTGILYAFAYLVFGKIIFFVEYSYIWFRRRYFHSVKSKTSFASALVYTYLCNLR